MNLNKILIIQTAFIGDVILTTPLIETLAREFPNAGIDFLTIPKSRELLESNPNIRNLIIFDKRGRDKGIKGLLKIGNLLKDHNYDLCITPHRSLRSAILTWKTEAKQRIGFNRTVWRKAFTHIITYNPDLHEIDRNLSLLSEIGLKLKRSRPVLYSTEEDQKVVESLIEEHEIENKTLFAVAPGSVWPTKRWPETYYKDFCRLISSEDICIVLIGSSEDKDLCHGISSGSNNIINMAGKLNLRQTYYLLRKCSGILTNDSAPLHLGMAADINVFAIFGPTVPEFGFAPFGPNSKVFENPELSCRPCAIHGSKKCPMKTFDCMKTIEPLNIANDVLRTISVNQKIP